MVARASAKMAVSVATAQCEPVRRKCALFALSAATAGRGQAKLRTRHRLPPTRFTSWEEQSIHVANRRVGEKIEMWPA